VRASPLQKYPTFAFVKVAQRPGRSLESCCQWYCTGPNLSASWDSVLRMVTPKPLCSKGCYRFFCALAGTTAYSSPKAFAGVGEEAEKEKTRLPFRECVENLTLEAALIRSQNASFHEGRFRDDSLQKEDSVNGLQSRRCS